MKKILTHTRQNFAKTVHSKPKSTGSRVVTSTGNRPIPKTNTGMRDCKSCGK